MTDGFRDWYEMTCEERRAYWKKRDRELFEKHMAERKLLEEAPKLREENQRLRTRVEELVAERDAARNSAQNYRDAFCDCTCGNRVLADNTFTWESTPTPETNDE